MSDLWKEFQDTEFMERKPVQGRPIDPMAKDDHYWSIIVKCNTDAIAFQLSCDFYVDTEMRDSRLTVSVAS